MLEKTGKIHLVPLAAHEEGGIYSHSDAPITLPEVVMKGQTNSTLSMKSSLRFDPSGTKLYAVDGTGRLLTVEFN